MRVERSAPFAKSVRMATAGMRLAIPMVLASAQQCNPSAWASNSMLLGRGELSA
jgi:hypothetical protein